MQLACLGGFVDQAEAANANEQWGNTIAMLAPWLNPISMLMRTGEADELADEVRGKLSHGLDLLGTAFANAGDLDSANEVLRLGVQWAGESSKAGDLFLALGRASVQAGMIALSCALSVCVAVVS